ncbi:MAG: hypothetical protein WCD16_06005 [Paracoccaceae bacterium]
MAALSDLPDLIPLKNVAELAFAFHGLLAKKMKKEGVQMGAWRNSRLRRDFPLPTFRQRAVGPPSQYRVNDGLADPSDDVAKPNRGRLETFGLPPTQPVELSWTVVFTAPD